MGCYLTAPQSDAVTRVVDMDIQRIMLFDLYSKGHHLQYLQQLASYWVQRRHPGHLDLVVPSYFVESHPSLVDFIAAHQAESNIHLVVIDEPVFAETPRRFQLFRNDREHGRLLKKYVTKLKPDHCVLMFFDHVQLSLARNLQFDFPVQFSGIYFRPSFHYKHFAQDYSGIKEHVKRLRKQILLKRALRNPHFSDLFCLDPYVIPHIESHSTRATFLPDGIEPDMSTATPAETRAEWVVEDGRQVALFFGVIDGRKGIYQVLEAVALLPREAQEKLCLALVGKIPEADRTAVLSQLDQLRQTTAVQFVVEDRFIEAEAVQGVIRGADLVLLPYQRHTGSSGVLIRAATEGIPVFGSDYGLVGEHIRRHQLGVALDTTSAQRIVAGLEAYLDDPAAIPFDAEKARAFAEENTAERFAATIFRFAALPVPALARP